MEMTADDVRIVVRKILNSVIKTGKGDEYQEGLVSGAVYAFNIAGVITAEKMVEIRREFRKEEKS